MFRRTSLTFRVTRALIAPLTVWCLGCSGFEPIVDAITGAASNSGMICGTVERAADSPATMLMSDTAQESQPAAASVRAIAEAGFDCGCGQACHGAAPSEPQRLTQLRSVPLVTSLDVAPPPSVVRTPLHPPPQQVA